MQDELINKIYYQLDMFRILSKLCIFAIKNDSDNINYNDYMLIFQYIEDKSWLVSEWVEKLNSLSDDN